MASGRDRRVVRSLGPLRGAFLVSETHTSSAVMSLPIVAWARRFRRGTVRLNGRLVTSVCVGGAELLPGPVRVEVDFVGGAAPRIERAVAVGLQRPGVLRIPISAAEADLLVSSLWDLEGEAVADAAGEVQVRFGSQVEMAFPGGIVRVRGAATGPPEGPVLSGPLEISAGNAWIRLSGGDGLRWLSSLAKIRVDRAVLHPDGRIALEGGARRGLDRAVRSGLERASGALSRLVRHSPRFHVVRSFLPA